MHVKSPQQSAANWIRKSLMAYLEGSKNLNWISGIVIKFGDILAAGQTLATLRGYGDPQRYEELARWFDSQLGIRSKGDEQKPTDVHSR